MTLRIYDTRSGKKVPFEPLTPGRAGIYSCGITVYDLCHVGHARMMVAFDVIVRYLRASGLAVTFVRNVTDVDDKIIRKAEAEKRTAAEVAHEYTEKMNEDLRALDVAPADHEPHATEHIAEVIEIIERLEKKGLAYAAGGDVYYSVPGFAPYGRLSGAAHRRPALRRAHRGGRAQEEPARLRALEGGQAGRAVLGEPLGQRASRAGTSSARRWRTATSASRSTSTAAAPTSSSRTTRTRSPSPKARSATASSPATGSTPGW